MSECRGPYRASMSRAYPDWRREFYCPAARGDFGVRELRRRLPRMWRRLGRVEPAGFDRMGPEQLKAEFLERMAELMLRDREPETWRRIARAERVTHNPMSAPRLDRVAPEPVGIQGRIFE